MLEKITLQLIYYQSCDLYFSLPEVFTSVHFTIERIVLKRKQPVINRSAGSLKDM